MYRLLYLIFTIAVTTHLFAQVPAETKPLIAAHSLKGNPNAVGSPKSATITKALLASREYFDASKAACKKSLAHMKKARETGAIDVFMKEAPIAIAQLTKAIKAYNEGQNQLKTITRKAEANEACYKLLPLSKNTRNSANLAGTELQTAAKNLNKSVNKDAYDKYIAALNAYFLQLDRVNVAAKKLSDEVRRCG